MYGERIAAFCKEYDSFFVEKEYKMRNKRETLAIGANSSKFYSLYKFARIYLVVIVGQLRITLPSKKRKAF